ncbi:MAG: hypothetical protein DRP64_03075 [Verrucomicrobia bacterium]|nr:MAG: hypothetical protein DRP64_03075 [Verrucomicrobiota bacterium]
MKRIIMMAAAGCVVGMLTGCGVPQEEHDAKIAELNTAWAEIETLKGKVTDTESLLKKEQGKVRDTRIKLDDASRRITELTEKEAVSAAALAAEKGKTAELESDAVSATSSLGMAQDRTTEVEAALATLQGEYEKLQIRFDELRKNILAIDGASSIPAASAPAAAPKASGSGKSDSETALDLLNEMSME